ncbi:hypothetical protein ABZ342_24110 [Amycolatopsis sp. NPDC005961]|uniref:DUF7660 family protein n=1 Tax=Amycolatopsis sp. NPDC005961 TaxID=3156720 RepID=UPI0033F67B18
MSEQFEAGRDRVVATLRTLVAEGADGPPDWENDTLPRYLEALAGWLRDCEGYYANQGIPLPADGWQVFRDALVAATVYE